MTGAGLIFRDPHAASFLNWHVGRGEAEVSKAAQVCGWCEWVRISLVAAALATAGLIMTAEAVGHQRQERSTHLPRVSVAARPPTVQPLAAEPSGGRGAIGAIHYWSDDDSTTVTVRVPGLVYFDAHRLSNPERVYFDLRGTRMPEEIPGKLVQVAVSETFLQKIRVGEREGQVTRVVLETKHDCDYSAMIAPDPYRLVVRLHARE